MVEIFIDQASKLTNPGRTSSRNSAIRWVRPSTTKSRATKRLASLMRRFGFCEERGSLASIEIDLQLFEEASTARTPLFEDPREHDPQDVGPVRAQAPLNANGSR